MSTPTAIRDRIKELRRVKASELLPNESNWRTHPEAQQGAMRAVLNELGMVGAIIARETPEGLEIIDGHLRQDIDPDQVWPVLVVDLDDDETRKALATFDPLSAMAKADAATLKELQAQVEADCGPQIRALMAEVENTILAMAIDDGESQSRKPKPRGVKSMTISMTSAERRLIDRAAGAADQKPVDWVLTIVLKAASRVLKRATAGK